MNFLSLRNRNKVSLFAILFIFSTLLCILLSDLSSSQTPLAGGATTVKNRTSSAYEQPSGGLTEFNFDRHGDGDIAFEAVFVTAPAQVNPGLGPLFNNASCAGCHIRNGRGLPEKGQMLVRVSNQATIPQRIVDPTQYHSESAAQGDNNPPVTGLGTQIQDQSVYGYQPEATVVVNWEEIIGNYGDGSVYTLRSPVVEIKLPNGESLSETIQTSLRIPPPVYGLGLLEPIPEDTIRSLADPEDKNGDGISGRVNEVWDVVHQKVALGRFAWKANNPTLLQQTASAYVNDMGVSNLLFPETDGKMDIDQKTLEDANFYVQTLAVPCRTLLDDPQVQRGEKLFNQANCNACHLDTLQTGNYEVAELANQTIHPYTDLLLHDMGEDLADHRPDFLATGKEWRTPPLWGIGLTQTVLPYASYLHDGRAKTLEEAILWHGGEAETSRETFRNWQQSDRDSLVRFLLSL